MISPPPPRPTNQHACGVDDPSDLAPVLSPVPAVGYFSQALPGHSCLVPGANGTTRIGYGYTGSPNSQNRTMHEITAGWNQTFYRDPKYGQVSTFLQYSYFFRNPWFVAPGTPKNAFQNAVWVDVRYTLPGSAPAVGY